MPANLEKLCAKWRDRLGLQNWTFKIGWRTSRQMDNAWNVGQVNWNTTRRTATVHILPTELAPDLDDPPDTEETVLHEMLHVVLAPILTASGDDARELAVEHAIDDLTRALITLDRREPAKRRTGKAKSRSRLRLPESGDRPQRRADQGVGAKPRR